MYIGTFNTDNSYTKNVGPVLPLLEQWQNLFLSLRKLVGLTITVLLAKVLIYILRHRIRQADYSTKKLIMGIQKDTPKNAKEYRESRLIFDYVVENEKGIKKFLDVLEKSEIFSKVRVLQNFVFDLNNYYNTLTDYGKTLRKNINRAAPKGKDGEIFKAIDPDKAWNDRPKVYEYIM